MVYEVLFLINLLIFITHIINNNNFPVYQVKLTTEHTQNLLKNQNNIRHVMVSHNDLEIKENKIIDLLVEKAGIDVDVTENDRVILKSK